MGRLQTLFKSGVLSSFFGLSSGGRREDADLLLPGAEGPRVLFGFPGLLTVCVGWSPPLRRVWGEFQHLRGLPSPDVTVERAGLSLPRSGDSPAAHWALSQARKRGQCPRP